eukprot:11084784-Alexandrium_andersonii.AAC.1
MVPACAAVGSPVRCASSTGSRCSPSCSWRPGRASTVRSATSTWAQIDREAVVPPQPPVSCSSSRGTWAASSRSASAWSASPLTCAGSGAATTGVFPHAASSCPPLASASGS